MAFDLKTLFSNGASSVGEIYTRVKGALSTVESSSPKAPPTSSAQLPIEGVREAGVSESFWSGTALEAATGICAVIAAPQITYYVEKKDPHKEPFTFSAHTLKNMQLLYSSAGAVLDGLKAIMTPAAAATAGVAEIGAVETVATRIGGGIASAGEGFLARLLNIGGILRSVPYYVAGSEIAGALGVKDPYVKFGAGFVSAVAIPKVTAVALGEGIAGAIGGITGVAGIAMMGGYFVKAMYEEEMRKGLTSEGVAVREMAENELGWKIFPHTVALTSFVLMDFARTATGISEIEETGSYWIVREQEEIIRLKEEEIRQRLKGDPTGWPVLAQFERAVLTGDRDWLVRVMDNEEFKGEWLSAVLTKITQDGKYDYLKVFVSDAAIAQKALDTLPTAWGYSRETALYFLALALAAGDKHKIDDVAGAMGKFSDADELINKAKDFLAALGLELSAEVERDISFTAATERVREQYEMPY